jgi:hypothetical protein
MGRRKEPRVETVEDLTAQQGRDDRAVNVRKRRREVRACDMGSVGQAVLDATVGRELDPADAVEMYLDAEDLGWTELPPRVLVGLTPVWGGAVTGYDPARDVCPGCNDAVLRPEELCLVCHATRLAPRQRRMLRARDLTTIRNGPLKSRVARRRAQTAGS